MINVCRLYPQYQAAPDRRTQNSSVVNERRSGIDRRANGRIRLDNNLTQDIFVLRNSVSNVNKTNNTAIENVSKISFMQKLQKTIESVNNNDNQDSNLSTRKNNSTQSNKSNSSSPVGMLAGALSTIMGLGMIGAAGLVVGVGAAAYLGLKAVKNIIALHIKKV